MFHKGCQRESRSTDKIRYWSYRMVTLKVPDMRVTFWVVWQPRAPPGPLRPRLPNNEAGGEGGLPEESRHPAPPVPCRMSASGCRARFPNTPCANDAHNGREKERALLERSVVSRNISLPLRAPLLYLSRSHATIDITIGNYFLFPYVIQVN